MASPLEHITDLLSKLAPRLRPPPGAAASDSLSASVASLAASLNSGGGGGASSCRTGVLDAALSLMCFESLEVDRARVECLVRTIASVVSASISCRVVRSDGGDFEMLSVGSSISPGDCRELVRLCAALLEKMKDTDASRHSYTLLYPVVKAAVLSPRYQCLFPLPYYKEDGESLYDMETITPQIICHQADEMPPSDNSIPLRVLLWHLDPTILKHDISAMVQEIIRRPLLHLRQELYDRMAWRFMIISLVCSPFVFMETRELLHSWFLVTGLGSVLELQAGVVSSALDVLFRPMLWGMTMELGEKLPFSYAYFPRKHADLLAILTGPLSCRRFLDLVSYINATVDLDKKVAHEISSQTSQKNFQSEESKELVEYNSAWSMIINFPIWFNFATSLIFLREGSQDYLPQALSKEIIAESINNVVLAQRAAFYLSWVLCPTNEAQRRMLADNVLGLSSSWISNNKKYSTYQHHTSTINHRKKLRNPSYKLHTSKNCLPVSSLLKEFDDCCAKFCSRTTINQVQAEPLSDFPSLQHTLMHLRIPLGILVMSPSFLNDQDCLVLLHYVTTREVLESNEFDKKSKDFLDSNDLSASCKSGAKRWALSGAHLIFSWLDIVKDMSAMIVESEDTHHCLISQLKTKTGPYLLKCVNLLLVVLNEAGQSRDSVNDLHDRLLKWNQKEESFDGCEAFEDIILQMKKKFELS